MCGFIAQLVEHRTGITEVMCSNPVEALIAEITFQHYQGKGSRGEGVNMNLSELLGSLKGGLN